MFKSSQNKEFFLGIDGGGSKCKAIITNGNNEILGTGLSGPGNPLHGFEQATNSIIESATLALKDADLEGVNLHNINAGIGLAGVNLPAQLKQMQLWKHPFKQMFLAHDLMIACLGAHQVNNGAVIITGTGSCGFSCIDEQEFLIGGHGFPQGDKGSGAWFGLQATKQVLLSIDGIVEPSIMNEMLLTKLSCSDATSIVEMIVSKKATFYAQLANIVFDAANLGDKVAIAIIEEGVEYIDTLARILLAKKPARISLLGGIAPILKAWLSQEVQMQLSESLSPPEVGAVIFVQQKLALQQDEIGQFK